MTENVNKGDFIEIEYDGRLKGIEMLFDTTSEANARKEGIFSKNMSYGPVIICAGETQLLQGLDKELIGKQIGTDHVITLSPEQAFGKKRADLMKLVPAMTFKKHGVKPVPGLQVNVDGAVGVIKTANSGRCIVDFNHPFAGKEVVYHVKIKRKVNDTEEQLKSFLMLALNVKKDAITVKETNGKKEIKVDRELPKELVDHVKQKLARVLPTYKDAKILVKEETKKDPQ